MAKGKEFKRRFRIRADRIARNTNAAVKRAALIIDQAVVLGTPVDTGRARSNWIVTVGSPFAGTVSPYAPGRRLGIGEGGNAARAINQGFGVIGGRTTGQTIWITNNVHYIGDLNRGTSPQAGHDFVGKAISAALVVLRKTRLLR